MSADTTPDPTSPTPKPEKPKAPRKESTRVAAANKIATTHPDPKSLLGLLGEDADLKIAAEAADIDAEESALATRRAMHRTRKQFVVETSGLDAMWLVGVKAILDKRSQQ